MKKWHNISRKEREHVCVRITVTLNTLEQDRQTARSTKMLEAAQTITDEIDAWYAALHLLCVNNIVDETEVTP